RDAVGTCRRISAPYKGIRWVRQDRMDRAGTEVGRTPSPPDTQKPPQGGFCVSGGPGTGRAFTRAAHKSVCHHSVTPTFAATACLLTSPTARRRYPIQPP